MEVVQPEFEVFDVPESISLPFEGFDFVVEPLYGSAGDVVFEIVEQTRPLTGQSFGDFH
jgi:hypothetical protein